MTDLTAFKASLAKCGGQEWERRAMLSDLLAPDGRPDPKLSCRPTEGFNQALAKAKAHPERLRAIAKEFEFCPVHFVDNDICHEADDPECRKQMKRLFPEEY